MWYNDRAFRPAFSSKPNVEILYNAKQLCLIHGAERRRQLMSGNKKLAIICIVSGIILVGVAAFTLMHISERRNTEMEAHRVRVEIFQRLHLAHWLDFEADFDKENTPAHMHDFIGISAHFYQGHIEISEVVFVHSPEEAVGFSDNAFVVWPSNGTTEALREQNRRSGTNLTLEAVLAYPNNAFHQLWPNRLSLLALYYALSSLGTIASL